MIKLTLYKILAGFSLEDLGAEWLSASTIWVLVGLALMILEMIMPGVMLFFFGLGAFITAVCAFFFEPSINTQLMIFISTSVVSLFSLRRFMQKIFTGKSSEVEMPGQLAEFVGRRAIVVGGIDPVRGGKVELNGTSWKAAADEAIEDGEMVEVISHDNITLNVKKLV